MYSIIKRINYEMFRFLLFDFKVSLSNVNTFYITNSTRLLTDERRKSAHFHKFARTEFLIVKYIKY
jgi:hypothetical protein